MDRGPAAVEGWLPIAATLEFLSGPDKGKLILLDDQGLIIGRTADCGLVIDDPSISRRHAHIIVSGGEFYLRDLGSNNGTLVDDEPVRRATVLQPRCRIVLGRRVAMDFTVVDAVGLEQVYRRLEDQTRLQLQLEYARRLTEQTQQLRAALEDLELFTRSAAHDLVSPLQGIELNLGLLLDDGSLGVQGERREIVTEVVETARRMGKLLQDLTVYSRLRDVADHAEAVDLQDVAADALANLQPAIAAAEARVDVGELPPVMGNRSLLTVLLQNLIGNAVKFRRGPGPKVAVRSTAEGDLWHVTVQDDGIGIPEECLDTVFDPFARLHRASQYEGNGMGLAIAHRIVRMHRGRIWVTSTPDRGTTFRFSLPHPDPAVATCSTVSSAHSRSTSDLD